MSCSIFWVTESLESGRWREVEAIYQSVTDREPEVRAAYVAEACQRDEQLRREVESLMKFNSSPIVVDEPAWQAAEELLDNDRSCLLERS